MIRGARDDLPVEWIEEDSASAGPPPSRPGRQRRRYSLLLVATTGVLVGVVALLPKGPATPPPTTTPATAAPSTGPSVAAPAAPVVVSLAGRPLMDVPPGWELIGRGAQLVRIELHAGRVTQTAIPPLGSTGPVYLVAGPDRVVIRPLDNVAGYAVPDGLPAQPSGGLLGNGGPAFAGPDSQHLWVETESGGQRRMALVGFDGTPTGTFIPSLNTFPEAADGTGYLVFSDDSGAYLARPEGSTRITSGLLLAAGPTRWLAQECDKQATCRLVVTDRATGRTHLLASSALTGFPACLPGPISPNGAVAALAEDTPAGPVLHLLDLATGRDRSTGAKISRPGCYDSEVWSPDSRALFFVDDLGALHIVEGTAERAGGLGIALPPMYQLAFRVKAAP